MTKAVLLVGALLVSALPAAAQEAITLKTPIAAKPAISSYTPLSLTVTRGDYATISVTLLATDGTTETFSYPCSLPCPYSTPAQVATLINALNTANLSTRSLWRRIFDRLIVDFPARFAGGAVVQ